MTKPVSHGKPGRRAVPELADSAQPKLTEGGSGKEAEPPPKDVWYDASEHPSDTETEACEAADTDAKLQLLAEGSPFIDLDHPITGYELAKLILMLPVVVIKVGG